MHGIGLKTNQGTYNYAVISDVNKRSYFQCLDDTILPNVRIGPNLGREKAQASRQDFERWSNDGIFKNQTVLSDLYLC